MEQDNILRDRVIDFLTQIGIDVTYKRFSTSNIMIRCPFAKVSDGRHSDGVDKNPSLGLKIHANGMLWNCFTCMRKGRSFISFIRELQRYSLIKGGISAYEIQNSIKVNFPSFYEEYSDNERSKEFSLNVADFVPASDSKESMHYHLARGIRAETLDDAGVLFNRNTKQVVFPQRDRNGIVVGWVQHYINGRRPKYYNNLYTDQCLYLSWLVKGTTGIVVEGMYDALKVYQHLRDTDSQEYSVVGTFGAEVKSSQIAMLLDMFDRLILMGDNDDAGIRMEKTIYKSVKSKFPAVWRFEYTGKDPQKISLKQFSRIIKRPMLIGSKMALTS